MRVACGKGAVTLDLLQKKRIEPQVGEPVSTETIEKITTIQFYRSPVLILVPDETRPAHLDRILPVLFDRTDILDRKPVVIVANGLHSPRSEKFYRDTYQVPAEIPLWTNRSDCRHDYADITVSGKKVSIRKEVLEYPELLIVGLVEPHYLAGFSGGMKTVLPGCGSRETVEMFHSLCLEGLKRGRLSPTVGPGTYPTPMRRLIEQLAKTLSGRGQRIQGINVVADTSSVYEISAGTYPDAYLQTTAVASQIFRTEFNSNGSTLFVVSPGGYPFDINLYQAQKSLVHSFTYSRPGDTIIFIAGLTDGWGPPEFRDALFWDEDFLWKKMTEDFKVPYHTAYTIRTICASREVIFSGFEANSADLPGWMNYQEIGNLEEMIRGNYADREIVFVPSGHLVCSGEGIQREED